MPESITDFLSSRKPTADRPLLGLTMLLVEDSRFASEAMRLLCLRSGARIRRADSLRSAERHLRTYRPSVIVVDLGLPDGSGIDLITSLHRAPVRVDVILATSGDTSLTAAAMTAGADGFLEKPIVSIALFQEAVMARLPMEDRPKGLRALSEERVVPDRLALRDDLEHALELLTNAPDGVTLGYASRFLAGLAKLAGDAPLEQTAADLARRHASGERVTDQIVHLTGLVADRLKHRAVV
jgi:FixJ family two-component response regulator